MFVKSVMIPKYSSYTIDHESTIKETLDKLEEHQIDGLPVLNGDNYVGMITRYGIYENYFKGKQTKEDYLQNTRAKDIATHQDQYLKGNEIFEKTLLSLKDFPLLAVLDEKQKFLGVVTRFDVLAQFQSAFGMNKPGVRIAFTASEAEGRLARLSEIARQFHEQIISIVTFDETDKLIRRIVMKIEKKDNIQKFIKKLEESGFRILNVDEE
ncbi:CBS domain-containing protein [Bacillus sp. FJAT-29937]|uniref:CBS domain-containing protein n=1 Tax=Bacillus sp. FJAT-29937 TaxID=1720553 RepID=UPI00082B8A42|nr:CBS domain-containing protein [Bacillus sp. FJAT-29937]